jgi:hypothetical protein
MNKINSKIHNKPAQSVTVFSKPALEFEIRIATAP